MRSDDGESTSRGAGRTMDSNVAVAQPTSKATSNTQSGNPGQWLAVSLSVAICLAYAGLVPLGQWQADEYDRFARLNHPLWHIFATRMLWTLRPWEALFIGYGVLVNQFHRPFTGWFLGLLWAGFLVCASATGLVERRGRRIAPLLSGSVLAAAFLSSGPLFQLFYWPAAAAVYLPILSATLLLFVQTLYAKQWTRQGRLVCSACLIATAFGGEVGATFVACFAVLQALLAIWSRLRPGEVGEDAHVLYWLLPGLIAAGVMFVASMHRLTASEGAFTVASPQLHHPAASAAAAVRSLALELVGLDPNTPNAWVAVPRVLSKLLIAAGMALVWARSLPDSEPKRAVTRRQIIVIGAAFLAASAAVLFGSYLHFGSSAGERVETLRRAWILMAYVAAAVLIAQSWQARRIALVRSFSFVGPLLLIAGVSIPWHISPLVRQYANYQNMACTTAMNFKSGLQQDTDAMTFVLPPTQGVITPLELERGVYTGTAQGSGFNDAYAQYMLEYFGKQSLAVVPNHACRNSATAWPVP